MKILKPPRLRRGDLIGVVSPASPIADRSKLDRGVRYLESLGYQVLVGESTVKTVGYLAGTDAERVTDLHSMIRNRSIRAVMCVRGGYGTPRLLHRIDYGLIARNPKILVGFSDITALELAIWRKCRLMTFHGPMVGVDFSERVDPFTEEMFWRLVTSDTRPGVVAFPPSIAAKTLFPGKVNGRLLGGNLALIMSTIGTLYQPDFSGSVLFIEDIGEEPYRVDRMLMQLRHASVFSRVRGVLAGQFTECAPKDPSQPSLTLDEVFAETAQAARVPFLANLPFGHIDQKLTLPVGLKVSVNADTGTLEFLEAAVC
jgi:muramoyltetrapeptide carboxypeptidase